MLENLQKLHEKIVLDCTGVIVGEQRGAERFICNIVGELSKDSESEFVLLVNRCSAQFFAALFGVERCVTAPVSGRNRIARVLFQAVCGPVISRLAKCKLWVATHVFPSVGFGCPTAAMLYDLMIYHHPESFRAVDRIFRKALIRISVPTFDAIFTISEFSKADIIRRLRRCSAANVFIVPCGFEAKLRENNCAVHSDDDVLQSMGLQSRPFILSVLGGKPYKNQRGLKAAAEELIARGDHNCRIAVVGDGAEVFRKIGYPPNLLPLGIVPDETLGVLYRHGRGFIFPTLFEGFGIPIIEAQSVGIPVLCSDIPVLREVSGGAAIFFDPRSPELMADAVVALLQADRARADLVERGRANAARYTWGAAASRFQEACLMVSTGRNGKPQPSQGMVPIV